MAADLHQVVALNLVNSETVGSVELDWELIAVLDWLDLLVELRMVG